jgi:hypothetical protein
MNKLLIRLYRNTPNAFYRLTDGSFMRAVPVFNGSVMRHCGSVMRRCDEKGQIIPRVRMSKKTRLRQRDEARRLQTEFAA